jgi:hypothetical protein
MVFSPLSIESAELYVLAFLRLYGRYGPSGELPFRSRKKLIFCAEDEMVKPTICRMDFQRLSGKIAASEMMSQSILSTRENLIAFR